MKAMFGSVATSAAGILLSFAFRVHDALLSTDAIWRTIYRRFVSSQRLLQWETAAEAEVGKKKRTPVDLYLFWTPAIVAAMGLALYYTTTSAFWVALPILLLWGFSSLIPIWLDRPPRRRESAALAQRRTFCAPYPTAHLAIFRGVQHRGTSTASFRTMCRKNRRKWRPGFRQLTLALLLNARQVAVELGYLTVPGSLSS